jgi:hypothetical protein
VRTRAAAVLLWLAATVAATLLVSAGVGAIRDTTRVDELVARPPATTADTVPATGEPSAATPSTTAPLPLPPTTRPPSTAAPSVAPTTAPPGPPPTAAPPTAAPPTTAPPSTAPPTTGPPPVEPVTLTIPSEGGSATIRFAPDAVTVLAATPAAGYAAKVSPQGSTAVRVEFESEERRSRIDASWNGGPVSEVRED